MKKTISMFLCGALVFNSISITVLANGYDGVSEVQENEASVDISETENADINNKYLEFIEQYKEQEVFYSIQNIKEGGKPVLLLAFPSENEWESEFLDDNTIYSNS